MAGTPASYSMTLGKMCFCTSDYWVASGDPATRGVYALTGLVSPDGSYLSKFGVNEFNYNGIIKLTREGFVDATFRCRTFTHVTEPTLTVTVADICAMDDGKILVVGSFEQYDGNDAFGAVIINSDGSFNYGLKLYAPGPPFSDPVPCIGCFNCCRAGGGPGTHKPIGGSIDESDNSRYYIYGGFAWAEGIDAANKFHEMVAINENGEVNALFDTSDSPIQYEADSHGVWRTQSWNGICAGRDAPLPGASLGAINNTVLGIGFQVIFTGTASDMGAGLMLYNDDGSFDLTFLANTGLSYSVPIAGAGQPATNADGRWLLPLFGNWPGHTTKRFAARLHRDGTIDNTFNTNANSDQGVASPVITTIGVQYAINYTDIEKIVVGGYFFGAWGIAGLIRWNIARLNMNGEVEGLTIGGTNIVL